LRFPLSKRAFLLTAVAAAVFLLNVPASATGQTGDGPFAEALDEGVGFARAGDRQRASEVFLGLASEYPGEAAILYNLALTYEFDADGNRYKGDNLNLAASYYEEALAADSGFTPARYNVAVVWHKLGYLDEAAREYRLVAKSGGELGRRAEYNLALLLREKGLAEEASELLLRDEAAYDDASRVRLLALLAEDAGEVGRAIRLWKRALEIGDNPTFNALAVKHLSALRGY
jgi:tetratricopeptide (TPR) repeat protein